MKKQTNKKNQIYNVKIKSAVHPDIYHVVKINLSCNEKMPSEKELDINSKFHLKKHTDNK